jgi:hypothetical protein
MNFGGLIAGAMGGGAQGFSDGLKFDRAQQEAVAGEVRRNQLMQEGETHRAKLTQEGAIAEAERKLKMDDDKAARDQRQFDAAETGGKDIRYRRDASAMQAIGADFTEEDARGLTPAVRQAYEGAGIIGKYTASQGLQDQVDAARSTGAGPTVRKELTERLDKGRASEAAAAKLKLDQDRLDETARKNDLQFEATNRKTDTIAARAASGGQDSAKTIQSTFIDQDGKKKGVMRDGTTIVLSDSSFEFNKEVLRITSLMEKDYQFKKLTPEERRAVATQKLTGASPASATTAKPAASISSLPSGSKQVGTSGGKPVFETADGSKRFIGQ